MAVQAPENACVSDNADEFDRRLASPLAKFPLVGFGASLVFTSLAAFH